MVKVGEWVLTEESSSCETICDENVMDCESDGFKVKEKIISWKMASQLTKICLVDKS